MMQPAPHVPTLLFYTYADRGYAMFAVPYVWFALVNSPDAYVEILLEDLAEFEATHAAAIEHLHRRFGDRFLFRQSRAVIDDPHLSPNVVRFVEAPRTVAQYVYIGDIDLLITEDVLPVHLRLIEKHGLPFSNIVRPCTTPDGERRLSGLHFCAYDLMYPLPSLEGIDVKLSDERVLYLLMQRQGAMVPEDFQQRPECGVHLSLSRDPLGRCTGPLAGRFGVGDKPHWAGHDGAYAQLVSILRDDAFRLLFFDLDPNVRLLLMAAEARGGERSHALHRTAASYLVDRSFAIAGDGAQRQELEVRMNEALSRDDVIEAERCCASVNLIWPSHAPGYLARARFALDGGRTRLALDCLVNYLATGGDETKPVFVSLEGRLGQTSEDLSGLRAGRARLRQAS